MTAISINNIILKHKDTHVVISLLLEFNVCIPNIIEKIHCQNK